MENSNTSLLFDLRQFFYLVHPNELSQLSETQIEQTFAQAFPWILLLIFIEFVFLDDDQYAFNDYVTSINGAILLFLFKVSGKAFVVWTYPYFYDRFSLLSLSDDDNYSWILCFLLKDFLYYFAHRCLHEVGILWAIHSYHHSSQYLNMSVAFRQGVLQVFPLAAFDILQAFVIPPKLFLIHYYLHSFYQIWIHTELVPRLGVLEYVLNTPSSHRVHHGRNPYCIDKNFGGALIIWDRLFGTYQRELEGEKIAYSVVEPLECFDQFYCQYGRIYSLIYEKALSVDDKGHPLFIGWKEKAKAIFYPPSYFPGVKVRQSLLWKRLDNFRNYIPVRYPIQIYNPHINFWLEQYLLVSFVSVLYISYELIYFHYGTSEYISKLCLVLSTIQMFGYYFDQRAGAFYFDFVRVSVSLVLSTTLSCQAYLIFYAISLIYLMLHSAFKLQQ